MYKLKSTGFPWEKFDLTTGAYRLGSAKDNEIVLEDPSVSAHHCEIVVTGNTISLRDRSPTHETYVDEQRVQSTMLKPGQTLRLGTIKLVLESDIDAAAAGAAAGAPAQGGGAAAAVSNWANQRKSFIWPALLLLGVVGIVALIQSGWFSSKPGSSPAESDRPAETSDATPESSGTRTRGKKDGGTAPPGDSVSPSVRAAQAQRKSLEDPRRPFNPRETNRPAELDVEAGELQMRERDYARAEPFLQRALRNQQKSLGAENPDVTKTLGSLGQLYRGARQFGKAEPFLQQALNNIRKVHGTDHPETASALNNLGELYLAAGQPDKAAPFLETALAVREKAAAPDGRELGSSLNNLAALKAAQGDFAQAKPLMERALKTLEKGLGPNDPAVAEILDNLGELNLTMGDPAKAEPLLQRALESKERNLPPDDPSIAKTLNSLSAIHASRGDPAKAAALAERALQVTEKAAGPEHPETAASLNKLAKLYQKMGDKAKAAPLAERAAKIAEKTLGPEHAETAKSLDNQATLEVCQDDPARGSQLAKQAVQAKLKLLTAIVRYASDQQRLIYRERANPYSLTAFLKDGPEIASAILHYKAVVPDSMLEDRLITQAASRNAETRDLVGRLRATKDGLAQLIFDLPSDVQPKAQERRQGEMKTLSAYLKVLEDNLEKQVAGLGRARRALSVTVDEVKAAIPQKAALLELVRYSRCAGGGGWEECYGAVVLATSGDPKWITLGAAAAIEKNITDLRSATQGQATAVASSEDPLTAVLQGLHKQLWAPIEPFLPADTKTIIISPDGALSLVPFATLLNSTNQFLAQNYSIRYVSSGRDLLSEKKGLRKGPVFIFGGPDFSARSSATTTQSPATNAPAADPDRQELQTLPLPDLANSTQEAAQIEVQAKRWDGPVRLLSGAEAGEAQWSAMNTPRIVHLATSGFFLPDAVEDAGAEERRGGGGLEALFGPGKTNTPAPATLMPESARMFAGPVPVKNLVQRSGVALAGAQATLKAWGQGHIPPPGLDGMVLAQEVGGLKLEGAELVVVSGCAELGSVQSGDSILALRRAFVQAGAENLLMTLRSGADEETPKMLEDFYGRSQSGGNASQAWADTQRDWLVRVRQERGLTAALRLAGFFILTSQGPVR
jgi:CHAT domain-containing protein/Tfp pilus assembly protein PilF